MLALAGCGNKPVANNQANTNSQPSQNLFTSIKDAISKSITLRCDYTDPSGAVSTVYIKGQIIRMHVTTQNAGPLSNYNGLYRDNKMYMWADNATKGVVIDIAKANAQAGVPAQKPGDIINSLEAQQNKCHADAVPASMFDVPTNVTFSTNFMDLLK